MNLEISDSLERDKILFVGNYLDKLEKMIAGGKNNLLVMADFDRTLNKAFDKDGKKISSGKQIRNIKLFQGKVSEEIEKVYADFKLIEADDSFNKQEKIEKLSECFRKQMGIMAKTGFDKRILEDLVENNDIEFRDGFKDFTNFLERNKIPLVIVSAAWGDLIELYLKKHGVLNSGVYIVSNFFKFDKKRKVKGISDSIVHMMNKGEIKYENYNFYNEIKKRKNIILLGDTLDDADMAKTLDYGNILKIGFLNENVEKKLKDYKKVFDLILSVDSSFAEVDKILFNIK